MVRSVPVAVVLAALAVPVFATVPATVPAVMPEGVTSTVVSVDAKTRTLLLADRTRMTVAADVDMSAAQPGARVTVVAAIDEDGFAPARAVLPAK